MLYYTNYTKYQQNKSIERNNRSSKAKCSICILLGSSYQPSGGDFVNLQTVSNQCQVPLNFIWKDADFSEPLDLLVYFSALVASQGVRMADDFSLLFARLSITYNNFYYRSYCMNCATYIIYRLLTRYHFPIWLRTSTSTIHRLKLQIRWF